MGRLGLSSEQHGEFVELVRQLRSMGAVRVRDGALEVSFAEPERVPEAVTTDRPSTRVTPTRSELDELAELRARVGEQEELG